MKFDNLIILFYVLLKNLNLSFTIPLKGISSHFDPAIYPKFM